MKKLLKNEKFVYFATIILGSIFIMLSCFHGNMWFDESYSVAIAKKSFKEIWNIGSHDVHPVLYYFIIKIIFMFSNNNIVVARVFSAVPIIILSILGFTHIRKMFGTKVGYIFTLLSLFSPACVYYAGELRMYSWAMLFVFVMCLYSYKIIKEEYSFKNWIIFFIFSLASLYIHYYALLTAFIVNVGMLIYFIKKDRKQIKYILCFGILQIILYLPWLGVFLSQTESVSKGFWISLPTPVDIITFLNTGFLGDSNIIKRDVQVFFATVIFMIFMYLIIKEWKLRNIKPVKMALSVIAILIGVILVVSAVFWQALLYPRYLFVCFGLIIFSISYLLANQGKIFIDIFLILEIVFSLFLNIGLINTNYDKSNNEPYDYVEENMQDGDLFITDTKGAGFTIIAKFENDSNYKNMYFYDIENWNVAEAYKAYGKTISNLDEFKNFKGRIWVISSDNFDFVNRVKNELGDRAKIIEQAEFNIKYQNYNYRIGLIGKN